MKMFMQEFVHENHCKQQGNIYFIFSSNSELDVSILLVTIEEMFPQYFYIRQSYHDTSSTTNNNEYYMHSILRKLKYLEKHVDCYQKVK